MSGNELGRSLITVARNNIGAEWGLSAECNPGHEGLDEPGATFVTLMQSGEVRGCIGTLEPIRALGVDVAQNALAAAFRDPRFSPLSRGEFDSTLIEVSLLSAIEPLAFTTEEDLLAQLRPSVDGVTIAYGPHRATFLPQVWQKLHRPRRFLAELKRKAGLSADFWDSALNVKRYQVTKWKESELRKGLVS